MYKRIWLCGPHKIASRATCGLESPDVCHMNHATFAIYPISPIYRIFLNTECRITVIHVSPCSLPEITEHIFFTLHSEQVRLKLYSQCSPCFNIQRLYFCTSNWKKKINNLSGYEFSSWALARKNMLNQIVQISTSNSLQSLHIF